MSDTWKGVQTHPAAIDSTHSSLVCPFALAGLRRFVIAIPEAETLRKTPLSVESAQGVLCSSAFVFSLWYGLDGSAEADPFLWRQLASYAVLVRIALTGRPTGAVIRRRRVAWIGRGAAARIAALHQVVAAESRHAFARPGASSARTPAASTSGKAPSRAATAADGDDRFQNALSVAHTSLDLGIRLCGRHAEPAVHHPDGFVGTGNHAVGHPDDSAAFVNQPVAVPVRGVPGVHNRHRKPERHTREAIAVLAPITWPRSRSRRIAPRSPAVVSPAVPARAAGLPVFRENTCIATCRHEARRCYGQDDEPRMCESHERDEMCGERFGGGSDCGTGRDGSHTRKS